MVGTGEVNHSGFPYQLQLLYPYQRRCQSHVRMTESPEVRVQESGAGGVVASETLLKQSDSCILSLFPIVGSAGAEIAVADHRKGVVVDRQGRMIRRLSARSRSARLFRIGTLRFVSDEFL